MASSVLEKIDWKSFGYLLTAGCDEVGRGCLAGPVYAAAVILDPDQPISGITDSKLLTPEKRMILAEEIKLKSRAWAVASCSVAEIDQLNILRASLFAMRKAVEALGVLPELVLIDGNQKIKDVPWPQETLIKGDLRCAPIGAASILAKHTRDTLMQDLERQYPGYGLGDHKGYPTPIHKEAIRKFGPLPIHRRTFAGVKEYVEGPSPSSR